MPQGVEVQVLSTALKIPYRGDFCSLPRPPTPRLRQGKSLFFKLAITAPSSNGRTAAFGAVYCGSNPCGATQKIVCGS